MPVKTLQDLEWSIRAPALIRATPPFPADSWFTEQAISSETALEEPPERFRLGIHFERIYQRWLERHPNYSLLASNLQVHAKQRTLGEFDLLVDVGGVTEHWELAIKFYINVDSPERADRWFGPDPHDTLHSKITRLTTHQLKLAEHQEAKTLLYERGIHVQTTRCIVKGRLYHPWEIELQGSAATDNSREPQNISADALPEIVNPHHLRGWWLAEHDLEKLAGFNVAYLEKRYWLSEVKADDDLEVLTPTALREFLKQTGQIAPQFAVLDERGNEISRGFILKPAWFDLLHEP